MITLSSGNGLLQSTLNGLNPGVKVMRFVAIPAFLIAVLISLSACGNSPQSATKDERNSNIRIAVAANFAQTLRELCALYEQETGQNFTISVGSTGSLMTQIEQGAPFDLFFAADSKRPQLLEQRGLSIAESRRSYAQGALVLWSKTMALDPEMTILRSDRFAQLAIANPITAPYGLAAQQFLEQAGLWYGLQDRLVTGQSIGQTEQYIASGAAQLGFVAHAQVITDNDRAKGSYVIIDPRTYDPITQQLVLLTTQAAARDFSMWVLNHPTAHERIRAFGYSIPSPP